MTLIDKLKEKKRELGISNIRLAELSNVPVGTINKIFSGETKSPRYDTLSKLQMVLGEQERRFDGMIAERAAFEYDAEVLLAKTQGTYTVEDYKSLLDEHRYELIDGNLYLMTGPTTFHQHFVGRIYYELMKCKEEHGMACEPMLSPLDVQLDQDDRTMVQPDVIIVCDRDRFTQDVVFGAPDFVCEVSSPSTRSRDKGIKLTKYRAAGVREYWIVDVSRQMVAVYVFEQGVPAKLYPFAEPVPLAMSGGLCKVDFRKIYEPIADLAEG